MAKEKNIHEPVTIQDQLGEPLTGPLQWRSQSGGVIGEKPWVRIVPYYGREEYEIKLDRVFGPLNWRDEYYPNNDLIKCTIQIKTDQTWEDYSYYSNTQKEINSNIHPIISGMTNSFKRTCSHHFGIGRNLALMPDFYAECSLKKMDGFTELYTHKKDQKKTYIYWKIPDIKNPISQPAPFNTSSGSSSKPSSGSSSGSAKSTIQSYVISWPEDQKGKTISQVTDKSFLRKMINSERTYDWLKTLYKQQLDILSKTNAVPTGDVEESNVDWETGEVKS